MSKEIDVKAEIIRAIQILPDFSEKVSEYGEGNKISPITMHTLLAWGYFNSAESLHYVVSEEDKDQVLGLLQMIDDTVQKWIEAAK